MLALHRSSLAHGQQDLDICDTTDLPHNETAHHIIAKSPKQCASGQSYERVVVRGGNGNVLLSHRAAPAVSWGLEGLTTVFGMGTGVSPPLYSPASSQAKMQKYSSEESRRWRPGGDQRAADGRAGRPATSYCPTGLPLQYRR